MIYLKMNTDKYETVQHNNNGTLQYAAVMRRLCGGVRLHNILTYYIIVYHYNYN